MDKMTGASDQEAGELTSTVIGANVIVRGDIEGATDLHVQGRVLGKVSVTGVILDADAEIDGPVTAEAVVIGGHVNGPVEARAVHVKSTGRIEGDVTYASLQIETGGRLAGRLIISDGSDFQGSKTQEPALRGAKPRSEMVESGQELVRMAARLRRVAE